ncbi:MAG: response regulator [Verrucomicrobiota bacterium]
MVRIKIILADDHNLIREGLRSLVQADNGVEIIGEAEDGIRAVQLAKLLKPDVAVLDILMPQLDGLEATRQIVRDAPSTRVLILSSYSSDDYVKRILEAGASGYLLKNTAGNDFLKAIREVDRGNAFFSPEVARRLRDQCRESLISGQPVQRCTSKTPQHRRLANLIELNPQQQ